MITPEQCMNGMPVWYSPSHVGPRFEAWISGDPRPFGDGHVVCLVGLPPAYSKYTCRERDTVGAAALSALEFRAVSADGGDENELTRVTNYCNQVVLEKAAMQVQHDQLKRSVAILWHAVADGVYGARSIVGDQTLIMKEILFGDNWPEKPT